MNGSITVEEHATEMSRGAPDRQREETTGARDIGLVENRGGSAPRVLVSPAIVSAGGAE